MRKALGSIAATAAIAASGLILAVSALAATPGSLSTAEYQQLASLSHRTETAHGNLAKMLAACHQVREVSPLVAAVRADCSAVTVLGSVVLSVEPVDVNCQKHHADHVFACALPTYVKLSAAASAVYAAEVSARRIGTARRLGTACIGEISDPADVVAVEKQLVRTAASLVADVKHRERAKLVVDSKRFGQELSSATKLSDATSPGAGLSLTQCKHA